MTSILEIIRRRFGSVQPIPSGIYHYIAPPHAEFPYRLHLRVEPDGSGLLIINAATVLHLNQTAAEYAYHLVQSTDPELAIRQIASRYQAPKSQIQRDFNDFRERILTLINMPDLDPVTYLDFDRQTPYAEQITAPYRLDCALTYNLPAGSDPEAAPHRRVERELALDEWQHILDQAWQAGIPHVVFTGGEPTLRPDLFELIQHAETLGQVTGLLTDGLKLTDPDYLHAILQTGLDHLMIILNPDEPQSWTAIEKILPEDIYTTVHLTLTPGNAGQAESLVERLDDIGASSLSLSATRADLEPALQDARQRAADLDMVLEWDLPVPYSQLNPVALELDEEQQPQGAGRAWLYVEPDGDVLPAQGINRGLGNFLKQSWQEIWKQAQEE
ncbi:MAG: radical SAM protein [Anaerolineales bacterium]|nr:radical SAM protein [Anaerolineales bacterium]